MSAAEVTDGDVAAVVDVLRSGHLALGPRMEEFEGLVAGHVGVRHAVAVSSGTAALHLIVRALGLGPGDEVLVPSFTFAASVNVIMMEGATPVFVDIDPETFNMDVARMDSRVTPRTRAVMAVDVFGHPVEWDDLLAFAERHGLAVIDDACEAIGARYRDVPVGRFGAAAAFAFYPNKQITTGEGGMLVTDRDDIARSARMLRNQGRGAMGAWLEHEVLGYNYRMDEMSAALGASQFHRLDSILERRAAVASLYTELLREVPGVRTPVMREYATVSWFVYVVMVDDGVDRDAVMERLADAGVPTRAYFSPIHRQPYLAGLPVASTPDLPVTDAVARRTLALPFHTRMSQDEVERVVVALDRAIRGRP
jgi:perosamine synthetase